MTTLQNTSVSESARTLGYKFFFNNLEYCLSKGRGFSLYNADAYAIDRFVELCRQNGLKPHTKRLSAKEPLSESLSDEAGVVIIIQDLAYPEFQENVSELADKLFFPLWFKRTPICFFSPLDRSSYDIQPLTGELLHKDYGLIVSTLLQEQIFALMERANYQFSAPEFLDLSEHKTIFTPIEELLLHAMEAKDISFQPQVRIGQHIVDFLVELRGKRVIVECDGKAYHDPERDRERDKVLSLEGYPICHFSGADIYSDADLCVEKIREKLSHQIFPTFILDDDLDPSQQKAVASVNGPVRVLAPAGSGKTKTLINRVLHLLNQGIPAGKILALAFNKKARDEMQERLDRKGINGVDVRTFHSLGYEIVREGLNWNFNGKTYKKTSRDLMHASIHEHTELPAMRNRDPLDAFLDGLRRAKMELSPLAGITVEYGDRLYPFESIFYSYLKKQLDTNFLDFDDMIYLAVRVLLQNSSLRGAYQNKFEFVLVDEFQDLNQAQILLLQILSLPENNVFAVGDDDQMIYGFRGADVRHIIEFDKRFSISSSHVLSTNYRSSRMVVSHSGWLINNNLDRVKKDIQPRPNAQIGKFEISGHSSLFGQAQFVAEWLVNHKKENNLKWRDYAILYRYNAYQFAVGIVLDTLEIPHTPFSGPHLFQTAVGRDIYSYLQVILWPKDATSSDFERILKRPNKYFSNQLIAQARNWSTFKRLPELPNLRSWEREKLMDFISRVEIMSDRVKKNNFSAAEFMQMIRIEFGLSGFYQDQSRKSDDLEQASDDVYLDVIAALSGNFKTVAEFYEYVCSSLDNNDSSFGEWGELDKSRNLDDKLNEVYLSTIHRAKGKEFENVVHFNLGKMDIKGDQMEEERRIVYVACTRPKDGLLITFPEPKPSTFLFEIAQNPKYKTTGTDVLQKKIVSTERDLDSKKRILRQMEVEKEKSLVTFEDLSKADLSKWPSWLSSLIEAIQRMRITILSEKIEKIDDRIKKHMEAELHPLQQELSEAKGEVVLRKALGL